MPAPFTGRFCAPGRAPPEPSPLSLQPCGPQARFLTQGPSRAGDPSRVPEADGNQRAPVPQAGHSCHKRYMGHPGTANRGCSVPPVGLLFPFIPSDPVGFGFFPPTPDESSSQKAPWGINIMKKNKKSAPRAFGVRLEDCQPAPDNKVWLCHLCQPSGTLHSPGTA